MKSAIVALVLVVGPGAVQAKPTAPARASVPDKKQLYDQVRQQLKIDDPQVWADCCQESLGVALKKIEKISRSKQPTREEIRKAIHETMKESGLLHESGGADAFEETQKDVADARHKFISALAIILPEVLNASGRPSELGKAGVNPPSPSSVDMARRETNQYLTSNFPKDPLGWVQSAKAEMAAKNYKGAFESFAKAIQLGQRDSDTLFGYGSAALNLGDPRLSMKVGQEILKSDPSNLGGVTLVKLSEGRAPQVTLPNVLADNLRGTGPAYAPTMSAVSSAMTPAEIAAAAQRAASAPPSAVDQSAKVAAQAVAAMGVKDFSQAQTLAGRAIGLDPRNAQAWNFRAIADNRLGQYGDAVRDASFALGLVPGNAAALQTRSWAFGKTGQYKEALGDANTTLEKEPRNAYAYYNRAFALAGLRDREGTLDSLEKAANLDRRFQQTYEQATQAPKESDLLFLFSDVGAEGAAMAASTQRPQRFLRLVILSLGGGLLAGLGLLHIFSARWRQTVGTTVRRMLGTAEQSVPGFWSGYTVLREIGSGGMGVVYEATDDALGRHVAIKRMREELRRDPVERRRFLAEARAVAALHHPHIVDIYSIVEDAGDVYLVFEYVDGRSVAELVHEKGRLFFAEARRIMKETCEAVGYAHGQGVIHRDLKLSNIMLSSAGRAKVMDFGVARLSQDGTATAVQTQTIVGTPPYMAPEADQGIVRRESDVFSLGVCFYEMVSGKFPFAGHGAGMLVEKMQGRHAPLSQAARGLPAGVDEVIAQALFPDPEKRFRTPAEFSTALDKLHG